MVMFSPLAEWSSCANFDRSHDRFPTIFNFDPIWAPFGAKTGPFEGPGGPEEAKYQVKVSGNHDSNPVRPIGSNWDQIWSPGALRDPMGPPTGPFGAKRALLEGPGVP